MIHDLQDIYISNPLKEYQDQYVTEYDTDAKTISLKHRQTPNTEWIQFGRFKSDLGCTKWEVVNARQL